MTAHRRLLATAALVGTAFLSSTPLCTAQHQEQQSDSVLQHAASLTRASAAVASEDANAMEKEFGSPGPEVLAEVVARRPVNDASLGEEEIIGRRKLMWWNWLLQAGCHGPLHQHCGGGGSHSGGSGGGSGSGGGGSGGSGGGGSGGGGSSASSSSSGNHSSGSVSSRVADFFSYNNGAMWLLLVAAAAVCAAIAAVVIGNRKEESKSNHPLAGSVKNRMRLFGNFADKALCGSVDRPCGRMVDVEMSSGGNDAIYNEMA